MPRAAKRFLWAVALGLLVVLSSLSAVARADEQPAPRPPTVAKDAPLVEAYGDERFFEGPTWDPVSGALYFAAFPKDPANTQFLRLDGPGKVTVWLDKSEGLNGSCLSVDGRLLGAQAYGHRVMSYAFGTSGKAEDAKVLYYNPKLNQPNDICQTPRGDIYFTDPDWSGKGHSGVYRLDTKGHAARIITDLPLPNGIKCSLDGRTLYVGDSQLLHWKAYPIKEDGSIGNGRVFFDAPTDNKDAPDGMALDEHGNLYLSGRGGLWAATPEGKLLGFVDTTTFCSNAAFGGADGKTLYLTCATKLFSLAMNVRGPKPMQPLRSAR